MGSKTKGRKLDHISICMGRDVLFRKTSGFERIELTPSALPDINFDEIMTETTFLKKKFRAPIFIEAMTGGQKEALKINRNLATTAQALGLGMGVGSQRAALEDPRTAGSYSIRDVAPDIFLAGNIGAAQLLEYPPKQVGNLMRMIGADALAVHLNAAQELVQPEGNRSWKGVGERLKQVCRVGIPIIAKEVGCGISGSSARKLAGLGVSAIDVAGAGGTSWAKVEYYRGARQAENFFEWGIPTAVALEQCRRSVRVPLIASGGIRNGVEAAKSIVMGADLAGFALPLLEPATKSAKEVQKVLEQMTFELKGAMFLLGAKNLEELKKVGYKVLP